MLTSCFFPADRACRPDCVFVRQHLKNLGEDYRPIVLGLQYGNVQAVNPLRALYNFTDRPWVVSFEFPSLTSSASLCLTSFPSSLSQFSQLITIQQKLGRDNFPLIEQTFYPNYKEMVSQINPLKLALLVQSHEICSR
jgi:hypothetical protein